jgi:hypothetical protein
MRIHILKSRIHRAAVTGASLDYEGSLTIAEDLIELAGPSRPRAHVLQRSRQRRPLGDLRDCRSARIPRGTSS